MAAAGARLVVFLLVGSTALSTHRWPGEPLAAAAAAAVVSGFYSRQEQACVHDLSCHVACCPRADNASRHHRYEAGQHFLAHEDAFPPELAAGNGFQRHATLLLYLNDVQQVRTIRYQCRATSNART
jgi:hypothetical protein